MFCTLNKFVQTYIVTKVNYKIEVFFSIKVEMTLIVAVKVLDRHK